MALDLSVVIPAFNESARLVRTLNATANYLDNRDVTYEILVINDGSLDNTTAVAKEWASRRMPAPFAFQVLEYGENRGKGFAVRYGVLEARGSLVLYMDADLATPIEEIEKLEMAIRKPVDGLSAQFAIGSRDVQSSQLLVRQPFYREVSGRLFNKIVQVLATPGIHDTQCGFKLLNQAAAHDIFARCTLPGFSFDVEAIYIARRLGYSIAEVPVRWAHQEGAAAFATKGAYLRHGLLMIRDLIRIRRAHGSLRRTSVSAAGAAPNHNLL